MRIKINRKEVIETLTIINIIPKVENITVLALNDVIIIENANTNGFFIKKTIKGTIEEEGAISVNPKELLKILKFFKQDTIVIETQENNSLSITSTETETPPVFIYYTPHLNSNLKEEDGTIGSVLTFDLKEFSTKLDNVLPSVLKSKDLSQSLNYIYLDNKQNVLNFVATDSYRLTLDTIENKYNDFTVFISPVLAKIIIKLGLKDKEKKEIKMKFSDFNNIIKIDDYIFTCSKTDYNFPDYENIMRRNYTSILEFNTKELLESIKEAHYFSSKATGSYKNIIKLLFSDNKLTLVSKTDISDVKRVCNFKGSCDSLDEKYIDSKFLLDALSKVTSSTVSLSSSRPNRFPIEITSNIYALIMPVSEWE